MAGTRALAFVSVADDEPELMVDGDYRPPPPLDQRIASVWLRAITNNPTDGYDVAVSAAFGKERITLLAGEFELETEFSLLSANVELEFIGCNASQLKSSAGTHSDGWTTTHDEQVTHTVQRSVQGGLHLDAAANAANVGGVAAIKGKLDGQRTASTSASVHHQQVHTDWNVIGPNSIRVGRSGKILDGTLIGDFTGWHIIPDHKDQPSMVRASIIVREDWVRFENVDYTKAPPPWRRKLADLLNLSGERKKRKEAFILLLRHLAQTELRRHQREREAVIAIGAIHIKPVADHALSLIPDHGRPEIVIPAEPLQEFLASEEGHEESTLVALGVRADLIPQSMKSKRGDTFVPESSPVHALEMLKKVHARHPESTVDEQITARLPNELRDLRALKLVTYQDGKASLAANPDIDPEISLRRAVYEAPSIKIARGVLRINPAATPIAVADAVALELGRPWEKRPTKQRNGGAIRRWAVWLEPHLIDPNSSGEAAALVSYATDRRVIKGRPATLTPAVEAIVRQMLDDKKPISAIAKRFKVSDNAARNWKTKLGYDTE